MLWSRSSLFLTQWLTAQIRTDIPAREVFSSFKRHVEDSVTPITDMLEHIRECAAIYRDLIEGSEDRHKPLSLLERFTYRTSTMQSEIVKPIVIWLTDPCLQAVPADQLATGINAIESWLVRRMLVREKSQGTNRFLIDLLGEIAQVNRDEVGTRIAEILSETTADVSYWPDDEAVRHSLEAMPVYRRGFSALASSAKGEQPVVRQECTIEHVMPQKWGQHWPLPPEVTSHDRDALIHTLGNLTLVSKALNPSLSNGPWDGAQGKQAALTAYSSIKITADAIARSQGAGNGWDETLIDERTEALIDDILATWPVPHGHTNKGRHGTAASGQGEATVRDLVDAGLLAPDQVSVSGNSKYPDAQCTVTDDGVLEVDGRHYESPSGAGKAATRRRAVNGWWFWRVGDASGPRLRELRQQLRPEGPAAGDE